jgi:excisionase family DNA binding protein
MSTTHAVPTTVHAPQQDRDEIQQLKQLLNNADANHPKLVDPQGKEFPLPDSVYEALKNVVQAMASGQVITLVPNEHELTTQEAADLLNVSRPYFVKLLDRGDIPYVPVGKHRRVRFQDLMRYKQNRDAGRRQNLNDFTEFLQEEGFYDCDKESSDCI